MPAASPLRRADGETAPELPAGRAFPLATAPLTLGAWLDAQAVEGEAAAPPLEEEPLDIQAPGGPVPPEGLERLAPVAEDAPGQVVEPKEVGRPAEREAATPSRDELEPARVANGEPWAARSDALQQQLDVLRGALSQAEAEQESARRAFAVQAAEQAALAAERERRMQANLAALGGELLRMASAFDQRMARFEAALEAALSVSGPGPGPASLRPPELSVPEPDKSGALLLEDDLDITFTPPESPRATSLQLDGEPLELSDLADQSDLDPGLSDPSSIPPVSTDKGARRGFWGLRTALAASGVVAASVAPLAAGEAAAHPPVSITASMSFEAVAPDPELSRVTALQQQADRGVLGAQLALAELFEEGRVVKRDLAAARTWTARAAEAGDPAAMHNLALLWLEGEGGPRSEQQARVWFERAARRGVTESAYNLARLSGKQASEPA